MRRNDAGPQKRNFGRGNREEYQNEYPEYDSEKSYPQPKPAGGFQRPRGGADSYIQVSE